MQQLRFLLQCCHSLASPADAAAKWTGHCDLSYDGGKFSVTADLWHTAEQPTFWVSASSVNFQNVNMWVVPYLGKGTAIPELEQMFVDIKGKPIYIGETGAGQAPVFGIDYVFNKRTNLSLNATHTIPVNDISYGTYHTVLTIWAKPKGQGWSSCTIDKVLGEIWNGS